MLDVTHLSQHSCAYKIHSVSTYTQCEKDATHVCEVVDGALDTSLGLLALEEGLDLPGEASWLISARWRRDSEETTDTHFWSVSLSPAAFDMLKL